MYVLLQQMEKARPSHVIEKELHIMQVAAHAPSWQPYDMPNSGTEGATQPASGGSCWPGY
jgi:hypothetical protein